MQVLLEGAACTDGSCTGFLHAAAVGVKTKLPVCQKVYVPGTTLACDVQGGEGLMVFMWCDGSCNQELSQSTCCVGLSSVVVRQFASVSIADPREESAVDANERRLARLREEEASERATQKRKLAVRQQVEEQLRRLSTGSR